MNDCDPWQNIMHYGPFDRMPVVHWAAWDETKVRWRGEGLAEDANHHAYFRTLPAFCWVHVDMGLYPPFPTEVLEETDEYRIVRDGSGVLQKQWKHLSCIPQFIDFTLTSAKQWDQYKARLQPHPDRLKDLDRNLAEAQCRTRHADPMALRRKFGRELRIVGGIDKHVLEQGRSAIDAEIQRRLPLMADGGYIPMPDHFITPGVPLADYVYYLERIRELRF